MGNREGRMLYLTKEEKQAVIFILSLALLGIAGKFLQKTYSASKLSACFKANIGMVNLNTATLQELTELPGIGMTLARRITEYRRQNGGFPDKESLRKIKGMNRYRYEKIKDSLYLR